MLLLEAAKITPIPSLDDDRDVVRDVLYPLPLFCLYFLVSLGVRLSYPRRPFLCVTGTSLSLQQAPLPAGHLDHPFLSPSSCPPFPQVSAMVFPPGQEALQLWLHLAGGLQQRYGTAHMAPEAVTCDQHAPAQRAVRNRRSHCPSAALEHPCPLMSID